MDKNLKKEFKQGISDLQKYISEHSHEEIKKARHIALIGVTVAFISFAFSFFTISVLILFLVGIIFTAASFIIGLLYYIKSRKPLNIYGPSIKNDEFKVEVLNGAMIEHGFREFSQLLPSKEEEELGFQRIDNSGLCNNTAFVSSQVDNKLMQTTSIPINSENIEKINFVSESKELRKYQLMFLVAKVGTKEERTFNERKICLQSSIKELINASSQNKSVSVAEVGYFDGLITNEAFRSKLKELKSNTEIIHDSWDLSVNFPMSRVDNDQYRLKPQPCPGVSAHIGISTIAISLDKQIVFFRQKTSSLIAGGLLVASGSGSLDFDDVKACWNSTNLKSVIQYAMARELSEEGNIYKNIKKSEKQNKIKDLASRTMITGFFRWVDRCGKPEFVGVSKLELSACDIPGDDFEVIKDDNDAHIFKKEIRKLSDFIEFKQKLIEDGFELSLSFYVALNRLITIAHYENSSVEEEKVIFDKVNKLLFASS